MRGSPLISEGEVDSVAEDRQGGRLLITRQCSFGEIIFVCSKVARARPSDVCGMGFSCAKLLMSV